MRAYAKKTLALYQRIHANEMIKMYKELLQFMSQKQRVYLIDYIYLNKKNLEKLDKEVQRYIDNIEELTV